MKNNSEGFSLIEILIVVVIIGILAAIAIPNLLATKKHANGGSCVAALRTLHSAQITYSSGEGAGEYAGDIGAGTQAGLNVLHNAGLIDRTLGSGVKSGYTFVTGRVAASSTNVAQFFFSAIPTSSGVTTGTGVRRFGIATDGVLKSDQTTTVHYADLAEVAAAPSMIE